MKSSEKELFEKYIYLENTNVLNQLDVLRKKTLLEIEFLKKSITRKKYLVGDESLSAEDERKVEAISPAFAQVRKNLGIDAKNQYLMEIATEEEKIA